MTLELCQFQANFLATTQAPTSEEVPIQTGLEDKDPETRAFFEECRESGRPYIDHHAPSGTFRYVYFNRTKLPTPKLMARLGALGWEFSLLHDHVLKGDIFAECFGDRRSIPYQGRFWGLHKAWSPERVQSFVDRLSGLLPSFDRPAAINNLVRRSTEDGFFTFEDAYSFGDRELDEEASWVYQSWCQERDHPYINYDCANRCVSFFHGKVLSRDAAGKVAALASRFGLEGPGEETDDVQLYPLEASDPRSIPCPDYRGFAGKLSDILTDPQSYEPQPA